MALTNVTAALQLSSSALKLMESLREQSKSSRDISLKENIGKLYDTLLDMKSAVVRVEEENLQLKTRIRELETSSDPDPCPKCRQRGWQLERSEPDLKFNELGLLRRYYKCSLCGFQEVYLLNPQDAQRAPRMIQPSRTK